MTQLIQCMPFMFVLQEALKVLRLIDDKIIYKLNKSIPTDSFVGEVNAEQKCQELYNEVILFLFRDYFLFFICRFIYMYSYCLKVKNVITNHESNIF